MAVSRDLFVQDIPADIRSVEEIPDDWMPEPLPFGQAEVVGALRQVVPNADVSNPEWLVASAPGVELEVSVSTSSPLVSFALHVRAADSEAADALIGDLLRRLNVRAFDPESETGIFQP